MKALVFRDGQFAACEYAGELSTIDGVRHEAHLACLPGGGSVEVYVPAGELPWLGVFGEEMIAALAEASA